MSITIRISTGELIDKITILELKSKKVKNLSKLKDINKELNYLYKIYNKSVNNSKAIETLKNNLFKINSKLWNIENKIRAMESKKVFDDVFISTARSVYQWNDKRAMIKNKINNLTDSGFKEIKEYTVY
jgi:hypothetical protein